LLINVFENFTKKNKIKKRQNVLGKVTKNSTLQMKPTFMLIVVPVYCLLQDTSSAPLPFFASSMERDWWLQIIRGCISKIHCNNPITGG